MFQFKRLLKHLYSNTSTGMKISLNDGQRKVAREIVVDCENFIFNPTENEQIELVPWENPTERVDAPFRVFSIEFSGDTPISSKFEGDDVNSENDVLIQCMVVNEIEPFKFEFFILIEVVTPEGNALEVGFIDEIGGSDLYGWCVNLLDKMLGRLSTDKCGVELINDKFKVGSGKVKRFHKIKKVIHVMPKRLTSSAQSVGSRDIDWSHRWSVRGHWRDHKGIGKDRDDNYCIEGKTWVKSHAKGPEDKMLIKKQRVVI